MAVNFHCMPSAIGAWSKETPFVPQKRWCSSHSRFCYVFFSLCFSFAMMLGCRRVQSKAILYPARFLDALSFKVVRWILAVLIPSSSVLCLVVWSCT
jgi:hypothetical protein